MTFEKQINRTKLVLQLNSTFRSRFEYLCFINLPHDFLAEDIFHLDTFFLKPIEVKHTQC